jgi:FAD/FMN-containing dehydrogenase
MAQDRPPVFRPSPSADTLARLATIVGDKYAIREPAHQAAYLSEWRGLYHGRTPLVLRPGSTEEVAAILKIASETGTAIVPQGGNTGLVGGQIPFESGTEIVVSLGRLDKIRSVDAEGNTLIAEAGVTLQRAQEAADAAGRLFPLSLASEGTCTIGGNLSTNAGGVAVLAYGNARDMVLGLEVVLASGEIWNGLRALRKDNTGYDLKHLFVGGEGTLGLITAAVLKLWPKPAETTTAFVGLPDIDSVGTLFREARASSGPALTAFEALPSLALTFLERHVAGARNPLGEPHAWYVLMDLSGFQGNGESLLLTERIIGHALEQGIAADAVVAQSLDQQTALWRLRETLPDTQRLEGGSLKHDVSVPVARIPEMIRRGNALIEKSMPGARPLSFGHFGDGNLHYNVSQPVGMDTAEFMRRWWEISGPLYDLVLELDGSISAEHGIGRLKRQQLVSVKSAIEIGMMRRIKQALDPQGILNPGKLL